MSIDKIYTKGFYKQTGYFAQWLPNSPLTLGTVGYLDGHVFIPIGTLQGMGIPFNPDQDVVQDPSPTPIDFVSSKGISVDVKLEGETNPNLPNVVQGKAGIRFQFSREGGFAIKAERSFEPRIREVHRMEGEIKRAYEDKRWQRNYMVVTQLLHAPYADILVSETSNSSIELQAEGSNGDKAVELGKASMGFSVKSSSGSVINMLGSKDIHPAFRLWGLKPRWFGTGNKANRPAGVDPLQFGPILPSDLDGFDI